MKMLKGKLVNLVVMAVVLSIFCALSVGNAEQTFDPDAFMTALNGSYVELFGVLNQPEYADVWLERCTEYVGEDSAQEAVDYLTTVCCGTLYGDEAVAAYGDDIENSQFCCSFIGGVVTLTIDNGTISGTDESGNVVFSHEYTYVGESESMGRHVYMTEDADAGEFTYFSFADDTTAGTYHLEFRYGDDPEALYQFTQGQYAYWNAAAISADYDDELVYNCIDLFCSENLASDEDAAA
jgi:hypothetical protein